jgi:hypothetical protein
MVVIEETNVELLQLNNKISGALENFNNSVHLLKEDQVYILVNNALKKIFIWIGSHAGVRPRFIGTNAAQRIQRIRGLTHRVISIDQGEESVEFLESISSLVPTDQFNK